MNLLIKMLSQRFNPLERETAHKFEFKNRRKQKDESVSDYGLVLDVVWLHKLILFLDLVLI
jgi:hypothetical protein